MQTQIHPSQAEAAEIIRSLITPFGGDEAYTLDHAAARARDQAILGAMASQSPDLRSALIELSRRSFWNHISLFVTTHDEKGLKARYRPFAPLHAYWRICQWLDTRDESGGWAHPVVLIGKSRQLMLSWLCMARLDWCCLHTAHAYCPVISTTDEDAKAQVARVRTIHARYPTWFRAAMGLDQQRASLANTIRYPNQSMIESRPQASGRATASRVPTMVLCDEAAHQDHFGANWTAIMGGRSSSDGGAVSQIMAVSSAAPSHMGTLFEDRLDGKQGGRGDTYIAETGLEAWRNRGNGLDCLRILDEADPARRSAEWTRQAKTGMTNDQWEQEHRCNWSARSGRRVFPMFDASIHVTTRPGYVWPVYGRDGSREWRLSLVGQVDAKGDPIARPVKLVRVADHGTTNWCACVWIAIDEYRNWWVYRTYKITGRFAPENAAGIARASWCEMADDYEDYLYDAIDAMQGLPDQRGQVHDLYRAYVDDRGRKPFEHMEAVRKGAGTRQEGLDAIGTMLMSTLAWIAPKHAHFVTADPPYEPWQVEAFAGKSKIIFCAGNGVSNLTDEIIAARYDEPTSSDPDAERPETTTKIQDDALDCLRYAIRGVGELYIR